MGSMMCDLEVSLLAKRKHFGIKELPQIIENQLVIFKTVCRAPGKLLGWMASHASPSLSIYH